MARKTTNKPKTSLTATVSPTAKSSIKAAPATEPPKPPQKATLAEQAPEATPMKTIQVKFVLMDLGAKQVSLCGDFNSWAIGTTAMKRDASGHWETTVALAPGRYQYKFVADGQWIPDPQAHENIWNLHGTLNSVVEVRA